MDRYVLGHLSWFSSDFQEINFLFFWFPGLRTTCSSSCRSCMASWGRAAWSACWAEPTSSRTFSCSWRPPASSRWSATGIRPSRLWFHAVVPVARWLSSYVFPGLRSQGWSKAESLPGHHSQDHRPPDSGPASGAPRLGDGVHLPSFAGVQGEDVRHSHVDPGQLQVLNAAVDLALLRLWMYLF